jgi:hypothetical protein
MLSDVEVSLRAWREDGKAITSNCFLGLFSMIDQSQYQVAGLDEDETATLVTVCNLSIDQFGGVFDKMHEKFAVSLITFSRALDRMSVDDFARFRADGGFIDVLVTITVESDEVELTFPAEFIEQIGRLRLPLEIMSTE